jgi:hypothetical protein
VGTPSASELARYISYINIKTYRIYFILTFITVTFTIRIGLFIGVADAEFAGFGRGVVALRSFQRGDVIMDYHGKIVQGKTVDEYLAEGTLICQTTSRNIVSFCSRHLSGSFLLKTNYHAHFVQ